MFVIWSRTSNWQSVVKLFLKGRIKTLRFRAGGAIEQTLPLDVTKRTGFIWGPRKWSLPRRTLSFGANLYARLFTGVPVHDMTAGFVGYRTEVLRQIDLDHIRSEGYAFLMEMKFTLHRSGATFCEFPIIFSERESGKSKFSRKILYEGMRFPLKAMGKRISGAS